MEEVYTCLCGSQKDWKIYTDRLECGRCGREYKREGMAPCEFNKRRGELLTKDAEIQEGSCGGSSA